MNNIKFTTQLNSNKNEILNFFGKEFYFNFLSNTSKLGTWEIGSRADHFGAHIRVQKFHQLDDNRLFEDAKFYYITFNTLGLYKNKKEDDAYLSFSLREDLIKFWADKDTANLYVLVVDNLSHNIFECPVKKLVQKYICHCQDKKFDEAVKLSNTTAYSTITFKLTDDIITQEAAMNSETFSGTFDASYYKPEYIANFVYASYRKRTEIVAHIYDKNGNNIMSRPFRSIKELYDMLSKHHGYEQSYKTLQRAAADEELIELPELYVYISKDIEAPAQILDVKDEVIGGDPNPFFIEECEEGPDNPRILVRTKRVVSKKAKDIDMREYLDTMEVDYINPDLELTPQEQDDFNYETLISTTDDAPIINYSQNKEENV